MSPREEVATQLLPIVAVWCALLSGCGPRKPATQPEKVTIITTKLLNPVLIKIAEVKGFFQEEGPGVTPQVHFFGKAALQSLLDGKAYLAMAADTPTTCSP